MAIFSDVFVDVTRYGTKIPQENYLSEGLYQIIDQGQNEIAGYSNNPDGLFTDVPAIIFGDHTRVFKYVDKPLFLGADGVKLLKAKDDNANYKYLYYALCSAKIPDTGYNRHFKWLKEVEIPLPDATTQEKIVAILNTVNALITSHKQQLAKLDELVKARFVEMFGDPIKNTQKRPVLPFFEVVTMQRGFDLPINDRDHEGKIPVFGSNGILDYHNIATIQGGGVITGRSGTIGKVYYTENDYWPLNTTLFSANTHGNNIVYLSYLLELYNLSRFAEGSGVPTLNRNVFHHNPIINIPLPEQGRFAAFVLKIQKLRLTIRQGLDTMEILKRALLQEYFGT